MTIGNRLKDERERVRLSQTAIAELAGTTKKTQIDYELNRTPPKASYLAKIASLGVDVGYVVTGLRAENVAHTPIELAYVRNCRLLTLKKLEQKGLDMLVILREASGIKITDLPLHPDPTDDPSAPDASI